MTLMLTCTPMPGPTEVCRADTMTLIGSRTSNIIELSILRLPIYAVNNPGHHTLQDHRCEISPNTGHASH